jgi:hypothetical protein
VVISVRRLFGVDFAYRRTCPEITAWLAIEPHVDARDCHLTARTIALWAAQCPDQYIADALDFGMGRSSSSWFLRTLIWHVTTIICRSLDLERGAGAERACGRRLFDDLPHYAPLRTIFSPSKGWSSGHSK